eukprot:1151102-Pelagomonas_calceolata.AAC.3
MPPEPIGRTAFIMSHDRSKFQKLRVIHLWIFWAEAVELQENKSRCDVLTIQASRRNDLTLHD